MSNYVPDPKVVGEVVAASRTFLDELENFGNAIAGLIRKSSKFANEHDTTTVNYDTGIAMTILTMTLSQLTDIRRNVHAAVGHFVDGRRM